MKYYLLIFAFVILSGKTAQAQPTISNFTPTSGVVGTAVTITGTGFSTTPASNIVYFGATKATVTAAAATQLTVTVPIGATYQPISVLVNGLIAYSKSPFSTSYPGWGVVNSASFVPKQSFGTGTYLDALAIGDLDGDGKADLVTADYSNDKVFVLRNTSSINSSSYTVNPLTSGLKPKSVAIGDVDGDGKNDIVVANYGSNNVSVLRNISSTGNLLFEAKKDFNTGTNPFSVAISDLDGDGRNDLAVANYGSDNVSVLWNISSAAVGIAYAPRIDYPTGTGSMPNSVAIGDLDGDRKGDLVVIKNGAVSILSNTSSVGLISFNPKPDITGLLSPTSVAIGDLNGDGRDDLAVSGTSQVSVFQNNSSGIGDISYPNAINYSLVVFSSTVAVGDLDGDGKPDLAVVGTDNSVAVLQNTSSISVVSFGQKVEYQAGYGPYRIAIGDLDGDGKADIATSSRYDVSVLRHEFFLPQTVTFNPLPNKNLGDAPFALTATASSNLPITYTSSNPAVATISGNTVTVVGIGTTTITASQLGNTNYSPASASQILGVGPFPKISSFTPISGPVGTSVIITGSGFSSTASNNIVYFGTTRATVTAASNTQLTATVPAGASYQPITVLINGLVAYSKLPFSTTYPGWGVINNSSFLPKADFVNFTAPSQPQSIAVGDLDGDGNTDLAIVDYYTGKVSVSRNTGSGTILAGSFPTGASVSTRPRSIAIGDLDGDGKLDLAIANSLSSTVSVLRNMSSSGNISFTTSMEFPTGRSPYSVAIGDLDGDGKADLAVANSTDNNLSVLRNTSSGIGIINFDLSRRVFSTGAYPNSIAIGDLDGDGKADLAVANYGDNNVSSLLNISTGAGYIDFALRANYPVETNPYSVAIGDLDGDGKADLAVANYESHNVSALRNISSGVGVINYGIKQNYPTGTNPSSVTIGDLDGDGKVDLAVTNSGSNTISALQNTSTVGSISYALKVDFRTGSYPSSVAIGDFNGDKKSDLAVTNSGDNSGSILSHARLSQTITFNALPIKALGNAPFTLTATTSSNLPITSYTSSNPAVATISGNTVTIVGVGTTIITASQAGNLDYSPATNVSQQLTIIITGAFPTISSFNPTSGPVGTTVTINGSNFNATPANNIVFFGATRATVAAASNTQLTVTVPVGASYQPISVLANGLIAYSKIPFSTTYSGWGIIDNTSFAPKQDISNGTNATSYIALGDLNGDGKVDMVTKNYWNDNISIFQNNSSTQGTVSYSPTIISYPAAGAPSIGDLDGDGKLDLVVANSTGLSFFRNTSSISAISFVKSDRIGPKGWAVIGELDGDGKPDLAGGNSLYDNNLYTLRNVSSGTTISFNDQKDFNYSLSGIAIGDLDGDGKPEIVVGNQSSGISIFKSISPGAGIISYSENNYYSLDATSASIAIGDLDGDGKLDLAVANGGKVSVFQNTTLAVGSISFNKINFATPLSNDASSVALGDLDGDGKADIAFSNESNNTVSVLKNTSTGAGNISFASKVSYSTGTNPVFVAIGDLDGDGKADLAVSNRSSNNISVLRHELLAYQTITFNPIPSKALGDAPFTLNATASSGLPVSYSSSNTSVATISGNTVTIVGGGVALITASQVGNASFRSATNVSQTLTVAIPQTISFSPSSTTCVNSTISLTATTSSGLPISYTSSNPAIASVSGNTLTAVSVGVVTITASQAGNSLYLPAINVSKTLTINPLPITTITATGSTTFCQGSSVLLSSNTNPKYKYQWRNNDLTIKSAKNSNYTVTSSGLFTIMVTDSTTSCSAISNAIPVTVNGEVNISPTTAQICNGSSATLTASGLTSYTWSPSTGLSSTTGASVIANPNTTTTYTVTGSLGGCAGSQTVLVKVTTPTASISAPFGTNVCAYVELTANSGVSYSWSSGETTQTIYPTSPGTYSVTVFDGSCYATATIRIVRSPSNCQILRKAADPVQPVNADGETPAVDAISAYPNPAIDKITIAVPWKAQQTTPVDLYDVNGKVVASTNLQTGHWKTEMDLKAIHDGVYIVRVMNGGLINTVKVVVMRK